MSAKNSHDSHEIKQSPSTPPQGFNANNAIDAGDADDSPANAEAEAEADAPPSTSSKPTITPRKPNAFEKLMSASTSAIHSPKRVKLDSTTNSSSQHLTRPGRNGLGVYLERPSSFGSDVIVYQNDSVVVIRDMYPKASVHLLVLPRTPRNTLHPLIAFQDAGLLASTKAEAEKTRLLVAEELSRMFGKYSAADRARRDAIASGDADVPAGRDWTSEVMVGIHAGPSMNHLHVHVLSRDMVSSSLRHRKHYNSFNTDFFVRLEEMPLEEGDPRWKSDRGGGMGKELKCWRCGRGFENKFERLKRHLAEEFEEWKTL